MTDPARDDRWPAARLDRIARVRALAAGLPGTWVEERVIDGSFEHTWDFVADLERSVPLFDSDVSRLRITRRQGTRLRVRTVSSWRFLWFPASFDVELEPGWCLMRSRPQAYVIVMAAEPAGEGRTRFAQLEGVAVPAPRRLGHLLRPLLAASRWRHRRHIPHDIAAIERFVTGRR